MKKVVFSPILCLFAMCVAWGAGVGAGAQTITVDPTDTRQTVGFGADVTSAMHVIERGNPEAVFDQFEALGLSVVRLPIVARAQIRPPAEPHQRVFRMAALAVERDMAIFASLATNAGNGKNFFQGVNKFGPIMKRQPRDGNVYRLNLTGYARFLDRFLLAMYDNGTPVSVLGPFRLDDATHGEYQRLFSQMKVTEFVALGNEQRNLSDAVRANRSVVDSVDVIGTHFHDDGDIRDTRQERVWRDLVEGSKQKPVWFTESARFAAGQGPHQKLVSGLNHFIPALRGGATMVILDRTAPRIVRPNGTPVPHIFSGLAGFIEGTGGVVIGSDVSNARVRSVSFLDGDLLNVHVTNAGGAPREVTIALEEGFKSVAEGLVVVWAQGQTGSESMIDIAGADEWTVDVPPGGYVRVSALVEAP